jgi:hypothetical protein
MAHAAHAASSAGAMAEASHLGANSRSRCELMGSGM